MSDKPEYTFLRCTQCGYVIARIEWENFKYPPKKLCCDEMNMQPWVTQHDTGK